MTAPDIEPGMDGGDRRSLETNIHRAAEAWKESRERHFQERSGWLTGAADRLEQRGDSLAELMARELGKPIRIGRIEISRTAEMLRAITKGDIQDEKYNRDVTVRRRPHGVVAIVTPSNNAAYIPLGKIAPAVLYGNAVVWKPAPEAGRTTKALEEILNEAGWPAGLVVRVEGGRDAAVELMESPTVSAVSITGSLEAGISAQEICAARWIPFQAELGGNNGAIVWPDADLDSAASRIAAGAFEIAGQRCTANRRVIVHEDCREALVQLLQVKAAALAWGDPLSDSTRIGPLVSAPHADRVASVIERAKESGDGFLFPKGSTLPAVDGFEGRWIAPVIIPCDDASVEIVREETFGPVLVVQSARDWDDAMHLCNGVRQGLAAAVFTGSEEIVARFLNEAEAGILKINESTADADIGVPFGGWKSSGTGPPEHGKCDIDFYTRLQSVYGHVRDADPDSR